MAARLTADGMQAPASTRRRGPRLKHQLHADQLGFFAEPVAPVDAAATRLKAAVTALDTDSMTPLEALTTLAALKKGAAAP
jgi:DNA mismatch repair protein MutS